jgi:hypothetical protein
VIVFDDRPGDGLICRLVDGVEDVVGRLERALDVVDDDDRAMRSSKWRRQQRAEWTSLSYRFLSLE